MPFLFFFLICISILFTPLQKNLNSFYIPLKKISILFIDDDAFEVTMNVVKCVLKVVFILIWRKNKEYKRLQEFLRENTVDIIFASV